MSFPAEDDVIALIEGLFGAIFPLGGIEPPASFPRLTWAEALARYGSDLPHLRYGLEILDLSGLLRANGSRGFRQAKADPGVLNTSARPAIPAPPPTLPPEAA